MLKPGLGRTHRAYLWSYATSEYDDLKTVIYDFADGRAGVHAREFLGDWSGKLVCDDYSGYKALFDRGVIEIGCLALRHGPTGPPPRLEPHLARLHQSWFGSPAGPCLCLQTEPPPKCPRW